MARESGRKDFWDKAGVAAGILSSVLIAGFGLYFNQTSQRSQRALDELLGAQRLELETRRASLQELQVVESMIPHLSGAGVGEDRKKLALIALRRLGSPELATEFAEVLGGEGAEAALRHVIATAESRQDADRARQALSRLTRGAGVDVENPSLDDIVGTVQQLTGRLDHFMILQRDDDDQSYMQTIGGPDEFTLEYRDGGPDRHFQCRVGREQVLEAFRAYAAAPPSAGDAPWRHVCDWSLLRLG